MVEQSLHSTADSHTGSDSMMMHATAQRLDGECEELEEQLQAARQNVEEQDAALNMAMEDKLTAAEEARQTLDDLAVFAEEVHASLAQSKHQTSWVCIAGGLILRLATPLSGIRRAEMPERGMPCFPPARHAHLWCAKSD